MNYNNLILATNIDNIIVYSREFVEKNFSNDNNYIDSEFTCVEYCNEKSISYMTNSSIKSLLILKKLATIIPITTKTTEHFLQIKTFCNSKYAITACGGTILIDGKPDESYLIEKTRLLSDYNFEETTNQISIIQELISQPKIVENTYVTFKVTNPNSAINVLNNLIDLKKWTIYTNNDNIYIIPIVINTANALDYLIKNILQLEKNTFIISAGNTSNDIPLLKYANLAFVPKTSLLAQEYYVTPIGINDFISDNILSSTLCYIKTLLF